MCSFFSFLQCTGSVQRVAQEDRFLYVLTQQLLYPKSYWLSQNSCAKKPQSFPSAASPGSGQVPQTVWSKVTGAMRVTKKLHRREQTRELNALLVLRRFESKPGDRTSSSCIYGNADTDASSQIQSIWNVLSYCSISLGLQIPTLAIGVDCVLIFLFCSVLSAMPLSVCVWWNLALGDLYVYQCNLEAFVLIYLRNVSLSLSRSVSFSLMFIYMHTYMQLQRLKFPLGVWQTT